MYSTFYHYYQIRSDKDLSQCFDAQRLKSFLRNFIEIKKASDYSFKNRFWFPFINISFCHGNENGYVQVDFTNAEKANLIVIIGSKTKPSNEVRYKKLLLKTAKFLNWEFIEEEAEDNVSDHTIWSPNSTPLAGGDTSQNK